MGAFNIWKENPPPREAVVMAKYALTGDTWAAKWQLVKTCKRGCCVFMYPVDGLGSMVLPKFWREPTDAELSDSTSTTAK